MVDEKKKESIMFGASIVQDFYERHMITFLNPLHTLRLAANCTLKYTSSLHTLWFIIIFVVFFFFVFYFWGQRCQEQSETGLARLGSAWLGLATK